MSNPETQSNQGAQTSQSAMSNHETDVVGFFFGVVFLVSAAAAIALRTVPLGESADGSLAVAAAIVLLVTGAFGIGGSLRNRHRRARTASAQLPKT